MTRTLEVTEHWGDWGGATGDEMIKWITGLQEKARQEIPEQDIRLKIHTGWNDKLHIQAAWHRPMTEEEILRSDHDQLMREAKSLNSDRLVVLKYQDMFPRQERLDRLIAEVEEIEAQMRLMDISFYQPIREELGLV